MSALELIKRHEGLSLEPYQDTVGVWTAGYGTNLQTHVITQEEAERWLAEEVHKAAALLFDNFSWSHALIGNRKDALIDMVYNLGWSGFNNFKNMIAALEVGDYERAADEAMDSKWFKQVKGRGVEIVDMIRNG